MPAAQGSTVLITGASSGIGRATSLYLAERGYAVIGTSRSLARLEELHRESSDRNLAFSPFELDINSDDAVERAIPELTTEHGPINVLVNNAGYGLWGPIESLSMAEVRALFETNFFAALRLIKAVVPDMVRRRSGTIINVSSVLGRLATPFNGAYAASKFALEGMSEAMRVELWPFGVRVALVEPGMIRTAFHEKQVIGRQALSEELPYYPHTERFRVRHDRYGMLSGDPITVARAIHKIVRSKRPAFRHPVGPGARLGILGARLIPETAFQALLSRATIR